MRRFQRIAHDFTNIMGTIIGLTELYEGQEKNRPESLKGMEQALRVRERGVARNALGERVRFIIPG